MTGLGPSFEICGRIGFLCLAGRLGPPVFGLPTSDTLSGVPRLRDWNSVRSNGPFVPLYLECAGRERQRDRRGKDLEVAVDF